MSWRGFIHRLGRYLLFRPSGMIGWVSAPSPVRQLADRLATTILDADPFTATSLGLREYDALLPDPSLEAEQRLAEALGEIGVEAAALSADDPADQVTLEVVRTGCANRVLALANRPTEYTVTAMPVMGPPALFAIAARTTVPDGSAAADYLTRLRAAADWIDGGAARLQAGAAAGTLPVGELVDQAIAWADHALSSPVPSAFLVPAPPATWDGRDAWRTDVSEVVESQIIPAVARWRSLLLSLRPDARDSDAAGVCALRGGAEMYERCIAVHTTLPFTAAALHEIGLDEVARLSARALDLGAALGLSTYENVLSAVRASATAVDSASAIALAQEAIRRAEARAGEMMPAPLPEPCLIEPMPESVAESGMAPHYTRPMPDGSRAGTFWFNTLRDTAGTGWDLEAVAFHEAVPGHHSQLARAQLLPSLPLVQQMSVTVHAEGWGLYAERLAGEFGLYSDVRAELGAVYMEMHRAARLVVDTGLHALGWSREQAVGYLMSHVALAPGFLENEVDRYIAWPGQALAYLVGQRSILQLRSSAQASLGVRFDLPSFNAALLDSGSVPMPVLEGIVGRWVDSRLAGEVL